MDPQSSDAEARLMKPKVIVITFHATIAPTDWEEKCIGPYLRENLRQFLIENWYKFDVLAIIDRLKDQSFDQHFVYETYETPLIIGFDATNSNWRQVIETVNKYVLWQMNRLKKCPDALVLAQLCWIDGFRKKAIKTIIFDDVEPALNKWRSMNICLGIYSLMEIDVCKAIISSTVVGDLSKKFDHFLGPETIDEPHNRGFYDRMAEYLNVNKKDILFICDYGQNVKMACENDLQGLLLLRPGNRKPRSYYLLRFPSTDNLLKIEFVQPIKYNNKENNQR